MNVRSSRWQGQACAFCLALLFALTPVVGLQAQANPQSPQQVTSEPSALEETIVVDPSAPAHPFPHYWEQMFGSGRAILSLRESYLRDLRDVKSATDFKYIRFHAIFHDEVGLYTTKIRAALPFTTSLTWIRFMTACCRTAFAHS